ncbi:MAG: hypothetical protein PHU81_00655 [Acidobacteriota bacterium]|nr:hypothetical protein [Acidobacteriota bacterium]
MKKRGLFSILLASICLVMKITPDRIVVLHGGQGFMSSHNWLSLKNVLKFPGVKIFADSFNEWRSRKDWLAMATQ